MSWYHMHETEKEGVWQEVSVILPEIKEVMVTIQV